MTKVNQKTRIMYTFQSLLFVLFFLSAMFSGANLVCPDTAIAASAAEIDRDVSAALKNLYVSSPAAKELSTKAKAILVFPSIVKGGFMVGGQYGEGALIKEGKTVDYYNSVAASYGLQAGLQKFGFALFFMKDSALEYLNESKGWEIGVGPSIVIVDKGTARSLTSSTAKDDIYAFFFDQTGLMAGMGLQGSKITKITPDK
jgi:lipid-binding SYLF domain-containing protein